MAVLLRTYYDLIEVGLDYLGAQVGGSALRDVKRAIQAAAREFSAAKKWNYYRTLGRILTQAPYSTGTIEYDHCVTPDHEILTRQGWKTYDQLMIGEDVMCYDHDSGTMSWGPLQDVHEFVYEGKLLESIRKGRPVLRCTPNHRIPVLERWGSSETRRTNSLRRRWVKASELTTDHMVPLVGKFVGPEAFAVGARESAVLAWAVTDGHGLLDSDGPARIVQSPTANPEHCITIASLTGSPGRGPYDSTSCLTFNIPAVLRRKIRGFVRRRGDLPGAVSQLSRSEARCFYEAAMAADGGDNGKGRRILSQWNEQNLPVAEAVQIAGLLAGFPVNRATGEYRGKCRHTAVERSSTTIKPKRQSRWIDYAGTVWCPQVATGAWLMRCNGHVMVTGNSGGAFERLVTLTTGTWPSWAASGWIIISDIQYRVSTRESNSQITLAAGENPGSDVASGTAFTLYQCDYQLPENFLSIGETVALSTGEYLEMVDIGEFVTDQRFDNTPSTPCRFTITNDNDSPGYMAMRLIPPPDAAYQLFYEYHRRLSPLNVDQYTTGTVSITSGSATVTGSGTVFSSIRHPNCVIRFSDDAINLPTSLEGAEPYAFEAVVKSVGSTTSITMDRNADQTLSAVKYRISSLIDLEDGAMLEAFQACLRKQVATHRRMENLAATEAEYRAALIRAREADNRGHALRRAAPGWMRYSEPQLGDRE
jgi:hypothetical protein